MPRVMCINDKWTPAFDDIHHIFAPLPKIGEDFIVRQVVKARTITPFLPCFDSYQFYETGVYLYACKHFVELDGPDETEMEIKDKVTTDEQEVEKADRIKFNEFNCRCMPDQK